MECAVLLSGGVDSSVALQLLLQQGYRPTAFYLKIWLEDELAFLGDCPWEDDLRYVRQVCDKLQVPLEVIPLQREYWDEIVSYTIASVREGFTPNPDVLCNQRVKFGAFYKKIDAHFRYVASGHYARIVKSGNSFLLGCSPDIIKDQTYFLSYLDQTHLSRILFPIGHLTKKEVREQALHFDLPNKVRKDSQGICFLGKLKFKDFVRYHCGEKPGPIIEYETGKRIGTHQGYWFFTIGQRQGIGLSGGPWYVVQKCVHRNEIFVARTCTSVGLSQHFLVKQCHWIAGSRPLQTKFEVKVRHGVQKYAASIVFHENPHEIMVSLDKMDQGIAPGQFAVFYYEDICLGAGVIAEDVGHTCYT